MYGGKIMERLTEREIQVLSMIVRGEHNNKIAERLGITVHTVKVYVTNIMEKFNAKNRTEVAFLAGKYKIVD